MPSTTTRVVANLRRRGIAVYHHKDWGSKRRGTYLVRRLTKRAKEPADTVVQHITVTLDTGPLSGDFKRDVQTVERIGYERFQSGVSYNFVVDMTTGEVAIGQPLDVKGTHTINDKKVRGFSYDQNYAARAIAVLGMEDSPLSARAERSIEAILAAMIEEGAITPGFDYVPHSLFAYKDCPCTATRAKMPEMRANAVGMVGQGKPQQAAPKPKSRRPDNRVTRGRSDQARAEKLSRQAAKLWDKAAEDYPADRPAVRDILRAQSLDSARKAADAADGSLDSRKRGPNS